MAKQAAERGVTVVLPDGAELTFNFEQITAREMAAFLTAAREGDIEAVARGMARIVVACPWGDASDPDTFATLPYYGAFTDALEALVNAGNGLRRKSAGGSSST